MQIDNATFKDRRLKIINLTRKFSFSDAKSLTSGESEELLQWLQVTLGIRISKAKVGVMPITWVGIL
jgi:hypothetical protein